MEHGKRSSYSKQHLVSTVTEGRRTGVAAAKHEDAGAEERPQRRVRLVPVEEPTAGGGGSWGAGGVAGVPVCGGAVVVALALAYPHPTRGAAPFLPCLLTKRGESGLRQAAGRPDKASRRVAV